MLRVYYKCTGNCHYAADADVESMDSDEEAEEQDSSNNDLPKEVLEEFSAKKKVARGSKCVQKVQIHVSNALPLHLAAPLLIFLPLGRSR